MSLAMFSLDGAIHFFRWVHFFAGVTWIGILYYFNFIQGTFFKETDPQTKAGCIVKLVPRALWWFRWGAMFTWLSGVVILAVKAHSGGWDIFGTSWGVFILAGALMGTYMFLNVWLIIWPAQQVVIKSAEQVANGGQAIPEAAACGAKAGLASRTNTLFSIPLLFFMGAAPHLPINIPMEQSLCTVAIVLGVLISLIELNGIKGKTGPITSVKGVIHMGILLTVVLYGLIEALT